MMEFSGKIRFTCLKGKILLEIERRIIMFTVISVVLFIVIAFLGYLINRARKRRMTNALGREVKDHELTSLTSWMEVAKSEDAAPKTKV